MITPSRWPRAALLSAAVIASLVLAGCPGGDECVPTEDDLCSDPAIITPNESGWWRDDVFYEIFVRSFFDTNANGKGDLAGVTAKLDYLNDGDPASTTDLGIDGVWLMPIFESPSYHGYDVVDYLQIDSEYGTLEQFDTLIAEAHARGIKVIIDLVLNHTSNQHPWFLSAKQGPDAPYRDYYVWRDSRPSPGWTQPWGSGEVWHYERESDSFYYGVYWSGMPDLNWKNPVVEEEFVGIMKFWLARGVDGFRVDAARYLVESEDGQLADQPETHDVFQRLRHTIHQEYPEAMFVAEAWTSNNTVAEYYGEGNEFQLAFNFDIANAIIGSLNAGSRSEIHQANYVSSTAFDDRGFEAPFLTNHDHVRVMRQLGSSTERAKLAVALLMAQPGTPFLYYGEEIGMVGGPQSNSRDEDKRTPMVWDATSPQFGFTTASSSWFGNGAPEAVGVDVASQQADPDSLWNVYRALIALRRASPALSKGEASRPSIDGGGDGPFAMLRTGAAGERVLLVANLATTATGPFTVAVEGTPTVLHAEGTITPPSPANGALSFTGLPPLSFTFVQLD